MAQADQDPETFQNPERETGGEPLNVGRSEPDDRPDDTYEPTTVQVTRGRASRPDRAARADAAGSAADQARPAA